jgi:hypothetical protein
LCRPVANSVKESVPGEKERRLKFEMETGRKGQGRGGRGAGSFRAGVPFPCI